MTNTNKNNNHGKYSTNQKTSLYFLVLIISIFSVLMFFLGPLALEKLVNQITIELSKSGLKVNPKQVETVLQNAQWGIKNMLLWMFSFFTIVILFTWWFMHKIYVERLSSITDSLSKLKYHKIKEESGKQVLLKDEFLIVENKIKELVSEVNAHYNEILKTSNFDALTGLLNRNGLTKAITGVFENKQSLNMGHSLIYINIDNFRAINDSYGHQMGDLILAEFANRLKRSIESSNLIARVSGDEFIIFFQSELKEDRIIEIEDKIIENISKPFDLNNCILKIKASIGMSNYDYKKSDLDEIFISASLAMKHAKKNGVSGIVMYEDFMQNKINSIEILTGLENKEFFMVYQPQIDSKTGEMISAEALVRWISKEHGFIPPDKFIGIAEDAGVINELGKFIMEEVFCQMNAWQKENHPIQKVSINLSPSQLLDKNLCNYVFSLFEKYKVSKNSITFEITEEMPIGDQKQVYDNLNCLNGSGISIFVDDFGKGYSALSYLSELPISGVKIDKSFVDKIEENDSIIKIIFALAKSLNLEVVVEGVETENQKDLITNISDCVIQGYYYSKPLNTQELEDKYFIKAP